jgi:hypothetical protein
MVFQTPVRLVSSHHGVPDAGQVGVQRVLPYRRGHLIPRLHGADARVRADDVEVAQLGHALVHGAVAHRVVVAADIYRDDVGAFLRQPDRVAAALATPRAGDESDLAFNSASH